MTETKPKRKPRKYTDEFKQQLVDLYRSGKRITAPRSRRNWYNHYRRYSSLGYLTPVEYRENNLKKVV